MKRIPPHNIESEKLILGTLLLSPESIPVALSELQPDDFYTKADKVIFAAIAGLFRKAGNVDEVLLVEELKRSGSIDQCGGLSGIARLTDIVPCRTTIKSHCEIVKDTAKARNVISVASAAIDGCYEGHSVREIIGSLGTAFANASRESESNTSAVPDIVEKVLAEIKGRQDGTLSATGITTGFSKVDDILGGLQRQDLVILAGRPSMGKTTFAMNMVTSAAQAGQRVLIFSLEMAKEKLVEKQISSLSGVLIKGIQRGLLNDTTWPLVKQAAKVASELPITVDDSSALDICQIQARAKMLAMRSGVDLIMVDYLQLAKAKAEGREREVSEISAGLKALAKDLKVPVIALSQLNRGLENRTDKRPVMSDLRDSGSIEQDADVIAFIYRDEIYHTEPGNPAKGTAEILIRKNRCGELGTIKLNFYGAVCKFENLPQYHN
ncbi:MAG: replicative DNA helicase [Desulforhopalus sp.]